MPDPALLADITAIVTSICRGQAAYSCLTGSIATGTDRPTSDIDIVVVLADHTPLADAIALREQFTRAYLDLHHRHHRPPDLTWPGEVCYHRDIDNAVAGGAFTLDTATTPLKPCPPHQSHRYWVSMIATGIPTTNPHTFGPTARRCARTVVRHVLSTGHHTREHHALDSDQWQSAWGINPHHLHPGTPIRDELVHELATANSDPTHLDGWRRNLRPAPHQPALDTMTTRWRHLRQS